MRTCACRCPRTHRQIDSHPCIHNTSHSPMPKLNASSESDSWQLFTFLRWKWRRRTSPQGANSSRAGAKWWSSSAQAAVGVQSLADGHPIIRSIAHLLREGDYMVGCGPRHCLQEAYRVQQTSFEESYALFEARGTCLFMSVYLVVCLGSFVPSPRPSPELPVEASMQFHRIHICTAAIGGCLFFLRGSRCYTCIFTAYKRVIVCAYIHCSWRPGLLAWFHFSPCFTHYIIYFSWVPGIDCCYFQEVFAPLFPWTLGGRAIE